MTLYSKTIHELHEMLKSGETTSSKITESVFSRIDEVEDKVRSYLTLTREQAMESAGQADDRFRRGDSLGALDGIPVGVKDIFLTEGVRTTAGSRILDNFIAPYDGTVISLSLIHI